MWLSAFSMWVYTTQETKHFAKQQKKCLAWNLGLVFQVLEFLSNFWKFFLGLTKVKQLLRLFLSQGTNNTNEEEANENQNYSLNWMFRQRNADLLAESEIIYLPLRQKRHCNKQNIKKHNWWKNFLARERLGKTSRSSSRAATLDLERCK